jgi:hypothetical protein
MQLSEADWVRLALLPAILAAAIVIFWRRRNRAARLLKAIAVLHVVAGSWLARNEIIRGWQAGVLGEADSGLGKASPAHIPREMVFWFLLWGPMTFIVGMLVSWFESRGKYPPASVGWALAVTCLVSVVLDPKTGFWWVLVPAFLIIRGPHMPVR